MTMLGQEKPSLEDISHHGVKGMKWGVRREDSGGGSGGGSGARRAATTQEIMDARTRNAAHFSAYANASLNARTATTAKGKDAALKVMEEHTKAIAKSDDQRVASMLTKGEQVKNFMFAGNFGLIANHANRKLTTEENFYKPGVQLQQQKHYSKVTNQVIRDHNRLSDPAFRTVYGISKKGYAKRIAKGDPNPGNNV